MYLLDTHILLWALYDSAKLPERIRYELSRTPCVISIATLWELSIKHSLGKLELQQSVVEIAEKCREHDIRILNITPEHCLEAEHLPFIHRDPFDRILIAQARCDKLTLVTMDQFIQQYQVPTLS